MFIASNTFAHSAKQKNKLFANIFNLFGYLFDVIEIWHPFDVINLCRKISFDMMEMRHVIIYGRGYIHTHDLMRCLCVWFCFVYSANRSINSKCVCVHCTSRRKTEFQLWKFLLLLLHFWVKATAISVESINVSAPCVNCVHTLCTSSHFQKNAISFYF